MVRIPKALQHLHKRSSSDMQAELKAVLEAFFEDHAKSGLQLNKSVRPLFDDLVDLS